MWGIIQVSGRHLQVKKRGRKFDPGIPLQILDPESLNEPAVPSGYKMKTRLLCQDQTISALPQLLPSPLI